MFVDDLQAGVEYAKNPPQPIPNSGAIYGMAGSLDGQAMLNELVLAWLDATYALPF
jgi:hypothetical protein